MKLFFKIKGKKMTFYINKNRDYIARRKYTKSIESNIGMKNVCISKYYIYIHIIYTYRHYIYKNVLHI